MKVVQEILGHSSPTLTMRVYTHTLRGQQETAVRDREPTSSGRAGERISRE